MLPVKNDFSHLVMKQLENGNLDLLEKIRQFLLF